MPSSNIYSSSKVLPYVYILTNNSTGEFYIGYRYKNKVPSSEDLGTHYFTSSKVVRDRFSEFTPQILAEFFHKRDAYKFETWLIKTTKCAKQLNRPDVFNKVEPTKETKLIFTNDTRISSNLAETITYALNILNDPKKSLYEKFIVSFNLNCILYH